MQPTVALRIGVRFVAAAVTSSDANGTWTDARLTFTEGS